MDDLQRLAARITAGWQRLARTQRLAVMIVLCAASAVGISSLRHGINDSDWQPIASGREFSAKEIAAIQTAWRRQGLTAFRRDGGMLNVPKAELAKYKAALPQAVEPESDSTTEWDKQLSAVNAFTSSEQLEQRKDNALRNELRRVLRAIPSIADADVIWARGKSRSAFGNRGKVTATVNITPKDGHDLTPDLAQSLRSAVASMIADLNPADIVVLDQSSGLAVPYEADPAWTARLQQRQLERSAKQLEHHIATSLAHIDGIKVQLLRSRSRETADAIAWNVSVSVPELYVSAQAARRQLNHKLEPNAALSELRREVASLLPAEFSKSEIQITTHVGDSTAAAGQSAPFTAWPHLILAGIAALCAVFGLSSKSSSRIHNSTSEPNGVCPKTSDEQQTTRIVPADSTETREDNPRVSIGRVSNKSVNEPSATIKPREQPSELATLQMTVATDLADALRHERPQTIAVLATRLPSRLVSNTLGRLPAETQREVICRLKSLGDVPEELVTELARAVCRRLAANSPQPVNRIASATAGERQLERVAA